MDKNSTLREASMDFVRTLVKSYGGYLVAQGWATGNDVVALSGGAAVIVGLLWSWVSTRALTK